MKDVFTYLQKLGRNDCATSAKDICIGGYFFCPNLETYTSISLPLETYATIQLQLKIHLELFGCEHARKFLSNHKSRCSRAFLTESRLLWMSFKGTRRMSLIEWPGWLKCIETGVGLISEAHLIDKAMTLDPRGINRRDDLN